MKLDVHNNKRINIQAKDFIFLMSLSLSLSLSYEYGRWTVLYSEAQFSYHVGTQKIESDVLVGPKKEFVMFLEILNK